MTGCYSHAFLKNGVHNKGGGSMEEKIETFINEGKLKKEPVQLVYVEGLLREAVVDLDEAQKTQEIAAHRATFFLSYQAMLRAGRALLLLHGLRPASSSQHQTIVDVVSHFLGKVCPTVVQHVEITQHKEHVLVGRSENLLTELEAHDAFHYAMLLVREIVKVIKQRDPQFQLAS
jgi:uncharacterized protein (UPF0332 family)